MLWDSSRNHSHPQVSEGGAAWAVTPRRPNIALGETRIAVRPSSTVSTWRVGRRRVNRATLLTRITPGITPVGFRRRNLQVCL